MRRDTGFSLIELLIVVAIIGIIAAIAIPNFTSSRIAANEAAAISAVRTLVTAQMLYASTVGNGGFAAAIGNLDDTTPPFVDSVLAGGTKLGYTFATAPGAAGQFNVQAGPQTPNVTGFRSFTSNESGVIYDVGSGQVIGQVVAGGGS